jgi:hypothetical protein
MYHGQHVFGYDNCRMAFIIEGKVEKHQVTGGYLANKRLEVDKQRFDAEIENLKDEGFEVLLSPSVESSMLKISRWAIEVAKDVQNGKLKLQYTYKQFMEALKKIPKEIDFSRLAKDHAQRKKSVAEKENTIDLLDSDDEVDFDASYDDDFDNDTGGINGMEPLELDKKLQENPSKRPLETLQQVSDSKQRFKLDDRTKYGSEYSNWTTEQMQAKKTKNRLSETTQTHSSVRKTPPVKKDEPKKAKSEYSNMTAKQLGDMCEEYGLPKTGTKAKLIERLSGPRPPVIYCKHKKKGRYVPACDQGVPDNGSTALLVAIQILQDSAPEGSSFTKDEIYLLAEGLEITKNPFSGGTTQTGPYRKFFFFIVCFLLQFL